MRVVVAVCVFAACLIATTVDADGLTAQRQRSLEHLLRHDCGSCHGMTLQGGLGPPLTASALRQRKQVELQAIILNGRRGTPMPPWRGLLSEADARWLAKRLKSGQIQ